MKIKKPFEKLPRRIIKQVSPPQKKKLSTSSGCFFSPSKNSVADKRLGHTEIHQVEKKNFCDFERVRILTEVCNFQLKWLRFFFMSNFMRILLVIFCSKGAVTQESCDSGNSVCSAVKTGKILLREWMMSQFLLVTISEIGYIVQ